MTPRLLLLQGAAITTSLFGYLIVLRGVFAPTLAKELSAGEALTLLSVAVVYGWWPAPIAAATSGVRGALLALVILDLAWAVVAQGLAGFAFCAIPLCPDFAPWSDLARYGSLVFGAAGAWAAWRAYRAAGGATQWAPGVTALVLTVISFALQAANTRF